MTIPALAVRGRGLVDPAEPVLRADDLGVQRGDGLFETARVAGGRVVNLDAHLRRLRSGAARAALEVPPDDEWRELAELAVKAAEAGDGYLKLVCTRGPMAGGPVTAFALVLPVPSEVLRARQSGVSAVTLSLGVGAGARAEAPWLLGGVKTTSYAVNMASLREAETRGAQEAIWLATGGEVLEAPTATVCWVREGTVHTPAPSTGILDGTTLADVRTVAGRAGIPFTVTGGTAADLAAADEVFLVSSVRGVAGVHTLDGRPVGAGGLGPVTVALRDGLEELVRSGT